MSVLGGLHRKHAVLCGIWVRTKQLLKELDKSRKILMEFADRRTFLMNTNSLSVVQNSGAITESMCKEKRN